LPLPSSEWVKRDREKSKCWRMKKKEVVMKNCVTQNENRGRIFILIQFSAEYLFSLIVMYQDTAEMALPTRVNFFSFFFQQLFLCGLEALDKSAIVWSTTIEGKSNNIFNISMKIS
jgi:hypothetical protein